MLSIQKATPADIPLIRDLTMLTWPQTYAPILSETQIAYMLEMMYSPTALEQQMADGHHFLLCYDGDSAIAFSSYSQTAPCIFKLHKLYILPGMQGRGIGRYMLGYIAADIKSDAHSLDLNVNIYNTSAIAFYKKMGFTLLRNEDIDIGGGYFMNDHVLQLAIS